MRNLLITRFPPRWRFPTAIAIAYLIANFLGMDRYLGILSGTTQPTPLAAIQTILFALSYAGFILWVPIDLIAWLLEIFWIIISRCRERR